MCLCFIGGLVVDTFNLNQIDQSILALIKDNADISILCRQYINKPDQESAKKLVEIFEKISKKMVKVKENVAIMVSEIDGNNSAPSVIASNNGFQINQG